jgi:hypothetical protein
MDVDKCNSDSDDDRDLDAFLGLPSKKSKYNPHVCSSALRGEDIPHTLDLKCRTAKLCVLRGICYYFNFAGKLYGTRPEFTRALNARSIMSNVVPMMTTKEEFPYCIWHPEVGSEATYRAVANKYPAMKYLVGRACSVAGELNLLPEVHISEEAHDNGHMDIFNMIISERTTYSVMNDYTRSLRTPKPANLNGDTTVRSWLEIKHKHEDEPAQGYDWWAASKGRYFNITEDMSIDISDSSLRDFSSGCGSFDTPATALPFSFFSVTCLPAFLACSDSSLIEPTPESDPTNDSGDGGLRTLLMCLITTRSQRLLHPLVAFLYSRVITRRS